MCQCLSKDTSLPLKNIVFACPTNYFMFIRSPFTFVFANLFTLKHRIGCRNELKSSNSSSPPAGSHYEKGGKALRRLEDRGPWMDQISTTYKLCDYREVT